MKTIRNLSRRGLIRLISLITAALLTALGFAVGGAVLAARFRLTVENQYHRALDELGYYCTGIHTTLTKGMYAGTNRQFALLAAQLSADAAQAKTALSSLPQGETDLPHTYRFLSQVGEYAMALTRKVADGGRISGEEWDNLRALADYSGKMAEEVEQMRSLVMDDDYLSGIVDRAVLQTEEPEDGQREQTVPVDGEPSEEKSEQSGGVSGGENPPPEIPSFGESFDAMESGFDGYPSLIYDGPFSEHIVSRDPEWLLSRDEISVQEARETAALITGRAVDEFGEPSRESGKIPAYCFYGDQVSVSVSVNGGFGVYSTVLRDVAEPAMDAGEAVHQAREYLKSIGYENMTESYYYTVGGVCTVNFAYEEDGVICYPDLIKVNVALDDGTILGFDARGYLMNHRERSPGEPAVSEHDGLYAVSPLLHVESVRTVIIPSAGEKELLCREYRCVGQDGEQILVYVNAETGNEEQILILLQSDNGTLTV